MWLQAEFVDRRGQVLSNVQPLHRHHQPVASPGQSLDKLRTVRRILKCRPQFLDRSIDGVLEVHHGIVGPQSSLDLFPIHNLAGTLQQNQQHLARLLLQTNRPIVVAQLSRFHVELECPDEDTRWGDIVHGSTAAGAVGQSLLPEVTKS